MQLNDAELEAISRVHSVCWGISPKSDLPSEKVTGRCSAEIRRLLERALAGYADALDRLTDLNLQMETGGEMDIAAVDRQRFRQRQAEGMRR